MRKKLSFTSILFNPFEYLNSKQTLYLGLVAVLLASAFGALNNGHFDGVLDFHFGKPAPFWYYIYESIVNLLSITLFLLIGNYVLKGKLDTINTLGTQALARFPTIFISLVPFSPQFKTISTKIAAYPRNINEIVSADTSEFVIFTIFAIFMIMMSIWMVYLMYVGFSKHLESTKPKKIFVFIISLILAEILSKIILIASFAKL
ncbi:hypothetical protein ACFLSX_03765 [Calditrichota bacterium]